jgi:hypothetical protein
MARLLHTTSSARGLGQLLGHQPNQPFTHSWGPSGSPPLALEQLPATLTSGTPHYSHVACSRPERCSGV